MELDRVQKIASLIQQDAKELGLAYQPSQADQGPTTIPHQQVVDEVILFDTLITDPVLRATTRQLFVDGHYALAVEEGYKCLNNAVKSRSGLTADGANLMRTAFSVNNPVLLINALKTQSQKDQQQGYMDIFAGCMTGIRNPRAHEHRYLDDSRVALELLTLANHLFRIVTTAKRNRRTRTRRSNP